jgi:hypothetical protein
METTRSTSIPAPRRDPWNKGRLIGQKRPLKPKDVWTIRVRLQMEEHKRDLAMFNLAIDSKLRGCDLVRLRIDDVSVGGRVRDRATVIQKKTGRPVQFEITEQTCAAVGEWLAALDARKSRYLFPSRFRRKPHLSTRLAVDDYGDLRVRRLGREMRRLAWSVAAGRWQQRFWRWSEGRGGDFGVIDDAPCAFGDGGAAAIQRPRRGSPAGGVWAEAVTAVMALQWHCGLGVTVEREVGRRARSFQR